MNLENLEQETYDSGPICRSIWDTRTKQNCMWCPGCNRWLSLRMFAWARDLNHALEIHQKEYCEGFKRMIDEDGKLQVS